MLILNPDLINSCRVCRSPNQDGDYQCLYKPSSKNEQFPVLSEAGILYEGLLNISLNVRWYCYPQFLCNSCDLQMKLFKKLKDRAHKTLKYLQNLHTEMDDDKNQLTSEEQEYVSLENDQQEAANKSQEYQGLRKEHQESKFEVYQENEANEYEGSIDNEMEENAQIETQDITVDEYAEDEKIPDILEFTENEYQGNAVDECNVEGVNAFSNYTEVKLDRGNLYTEEEISSTNSAQAKIRLKLEPDIDENDYVTEIYELLQDETYTDNDDNVVEYDVHAEENIEDTSANDDIEYVLEEYIYYPEDKQIKNKNLFQHKMINKNYKNKISTITKRREYKCMLCQLEFKNSQEHKLHRTQVHNEKYPCGICFKELKSTAALHHHMKTHSEKPAYQCGICQKTFSQKANYQYHMNNHNNIRNFKCNLCEKAFIAKADLKVHLRLHTGQRPYVCNICGKDYLMMEHLKTHLLTHTEQYFQCDICNNKFSTHKTLRLHVKTIHAEVPRFKCSFCLKPFRRKHHLQYHLKLHEKNLNLLDSAYEIVDDSDIVRNEMDCDPDYLVEQDADDPGFIALKDDIP